MRENEDANVEYKSELNNHLKREIVSFLNSKNGGTIFLGVDDKTKESLKISDNIRHSWEETVTNWSSNAFYPIPYSLIDVLPNNINFTIKVRAGRNKPYAIAKNGFDATGVYVRNGSSAVRASNEQVRRMQQQYDVSGEFDGETADEQSLTFTVASSVFKRIGLNFDEKALRMIHSGNGAYNNSALLISDQNLYTAKLAVYEGLDVMTFKDKREFKGAITKQIDDVLNYLELVNRNRVVITGKAQRFERSDYASVAIREAVVNAFVHRDYLLHSGVKIELFDDRLEIVSPGGIPDGLSLQEIKDGLTAARNPRLIHILDKMKYIENYGTGIRRIIAAYDDVESQPQFSVRENSFKVVLPNKNYELKAEESFVNKASNNELNKNSYLILNLLQNASLAMKRSDIQDSSGLSRSQVLKALKELQDNKLIKTVGASVSTKYQII